MNTTGKETNDFIMLIDEAFRTTAYPGDKNLIKPRQFTGNKDINILNNFKQKTWQQISSDTVFDYPEALIHFTDIAFAYYLPSYLRATFDGIEKYSDSVVITELSERPLGRRNILELDSIATLFTHEQLICIKEYFKLLNLLYGQNNPKGLNVFTKYWERYK